MKNAEFWKSTKFILKNGAPKANGRNIYPGSFVLISILAKVYFNAINKYAQGRLMDLGCGNVPLYDFYRNQVEDVVCVDWENSFHENAFLDYTFDLNQPFPLVIGKFDTILSTDVLEHLENPELFFGEIKKFLNKNGKLILSTPFLYWIHEPPYDFNRYTEYKLRKLCEKNDLKVIQLEPYGGILEVVADLISKSISNKKILIKVFNKIAPFILNFKLLKRYSKKHSSLFPLGYILIAEK